MDKRYYYRILGLREGASTSEIKAAYDKQMRRLKQPDYSDDPEYVARKMDQIRHAYKVLAGGAPPATKEQKEFGFEKLKDALDGGEDTFEDLKRAFKRHTDDCEAETRRTAGKTAKRTFYSPDERRSKDESDRNTRIVKLVVIGIIVLSVFSSLISGCFALVSELAYDVKSNVTGLEYEMEYDSQEDYLAETQEQVDQILEVAAAFDYEGYLDADGQEAAQEKVEWNISEETYEEIWGDMTDIAYYLGLYGNSEAIECITGDADYYWEHDDLENALTLVSIMNPPAFEEIAGCRNMYTMEYIYTYHDYFEFLKNVVEDQSYVIA